LGRAPLNAAWQSPAREGEEKEKGMRSFAVQCAVAYEVDAIKRGERSGVATTSSLSAWIVEKEKKKKRTTQGGPLISLTGVARKKKGGG